MGSISCSVDSCHYNVEHICGANILNIGGSNARITESTCCETYLKQSKYSNLADQEIQKGNTEVIFCSVNTCAYHEKNHCKLEAIEVSSLKEVETYTETDCLSFERQ